MWVFIIKGFLSYRKLREGLERAENTNEKWFEIIVGSGHHSRDRRQRIRPTVEKYLGEREKSFHEVNKGALVITFKEYDGEQPCFGDYYCSKCDNGWSSHLSWVGYGQDCNLCEQKCSPLKQRPRPAQHNNPLLRESSGNPSNHEERCEKCKESKKEYGVSCSKLPRR